MPWMQARLPGGQVTGNPFHLETVPQPGDTIHAHERYLFVVSVVSPPGAAIHLCT